MTNISYPTQLLIIILKEGEVKQNSLQFKDLFLFRLSLGMSGFEQQASGAVLDLMQDEELDMKRLRRIKKWYGICLRVGVDVYKIVRCSVYRDRKRKRFVGGVTEANKRKKIKTESGHWIDATYKSGMYPPSSTENF